MKFVVFFALLAYASAQNALCDPDMIDEPVCTKDNLNVPIRNWSNPFVYRLCTAAGAKAESIKCPQGLLFYTIPKECVKPKEWLWLPPCAD